jgi:hypothetical protein
MLAVRGSFFRRGTGVAARWQGVAAHLRLNPSEKVGLTLRGEWFDDEDGARTGTVQALKEVKSDALVFDEAGAFTDTQTTLALNAIYSF